MKKNSQKKDSDIEARILRHQHKIKELDSVQHLKQLNLECVQTNLFKGEYSNSVRVIRPSHQTIEEECGYVS